MSEMIGFALLAVIFLCWTLFTDIFDVIPMFRTFSNIWSSSVGVI
jgi:hypothetical protein